MRCRLLLLVSLLAAGGASWLSGCSDGRALDRERYRPAPDTARVALETVLSEWKAGRFAGTIAGRAPQIKIVDSRQKPEFPLEEFEILGEVAAEGYRAFAVRLQCAPPRGVERVRYVVIGIDPLWVFREEDYDMLAHWDHAMGPAPPAAGGQAPEAENATGPSSAPLLPEVAPDE